jgi:hypothetical protein
MLSVHDELEVVVQIEAEEERVSLLMDKTCLAGCF